MRGRPAAPAAAHASAPAAAYGSAPAARHAGPGIISTIADELNGRVRLVTGGP